jgi:hypothetical protein
MRDHQDVKILDGGVIISIVQSQDQVVARVVQHQVILQLQHLVVLQHRDVVQTLTAVQVIGFAKLMEPVLDIHVMLGIGAQRVI